ncbi:hypothetical protein BH09MYX1_BH09MYX1_53570 [soil metagenome]
MIGARIAIVVAIAIGGSALGCAGDRPKLPILADVEGARTAPAARAAQAKAPQAYAEAEALQKEALKAHDDGDDVTAELLAQRALAAFEHAAVLARGSDAMRDTAAIEADLAQKETELSALFAARAEASKQGEELAKRVAVLHALRAPQNSDATDPQREAARLVAARGLAMDARLLCGAARLVDKSAAGLADVEKAALDLDKKLDGAVKPAPIDDAASARVACLGALTRARRAGPPASTAADVLLTELSAANLSPSRDERGVVVTVRDAFRGNALSPDAQKALEALGRVAAAHADVGIQLVVHDSTTLAGGADRAKTAAAGLVTGGAKADRTTSDWAGVKIPIVDPADAKNRGRNARVDVVFVTVGP